MQTPPDTYEARAERVALLTIHAAKGLEFDAVFIVGCEDGTLPWIVGEDGDPESPHEERRLLYVGMTRARRFLWLGATRRLRRFGQHQGIGRRAGQHRRAKVLQNVHLSPGQAARDRDHRRG